MEKPYWLKQKENYSQKPWDIKQKPQRQPQYRLTSCLSGRYEYLPNNTGFCHSSFLSTPLFFTRDYKSLLLRILYILYYNIENQTGNKLVASSLLGSSHGPEWWYADCQRRKGRHQWPSSFLFQRHILLAFLLTSKLRYLVKVRHMFKLHVHLFLAW